MLYMGVKFLVPETDLNITYADFLVTEYCTHLTIKVLFHLNTSINGLHCSVYSKSYSVWHLSFSKHGTSPWKV